MPERQHHRGFQSEHVLMRHSGNDGDRVPLPYTETRAGRLRHRSQGAPGFCAGRRLTRAARCEGDGNDLIERYKRDVRGGHPACAACGLTRLDSMPSIASPESVRQ